MTALSHVPKFSDKEKLEYAKRELALRCRAYHKLVASGKMDATIAKTEIALMEDIAADYQARLDVAKER